MLLWRVALKRARSSYRRSLFERCYSNNSRQFPNQAQVVVCGGGAIGCGLAYHLPKVGFKDVVLLEQGSVSCGTSWHAAGLIGQIKGSVPETKILSQGVKLYPRLEEELGFSTGFKQTGSLALARNKARLTVLRRTQAVGRICGIESEIISPREARNICPLIRTDDLLAALWIPGDGVATSSDVCQALSRGAMMQGVQLFEKVRVERVEVENGRVCGVKTNRGDMKCEIFVNCAGQWARELGQLSDPPVKVPLHSAEHFYMVTKPMGVDPMMPVVRDPCGWIFMREWSGGLLAGGFEPEGKPCFHDGIPEAFEYQLLPDDPDHFQILIESILHRVPSMEHTEIRQMINGPESFTPDAHPLLGEVPEVQNYYVAAGLNSQGIMSAAGVGRTMAEWIAGGEPPFDLWSVDIRRFNSSHNNKSYLRERTVESLGRLYAMPWPHLEWESGRNVKKTPLHERLDAAGASWGCVMGWERPNWFARSNNESRVNDKTFDWPNWFDRVREEHMACRENVALFDLSSFSKFEIEGSGVENALQLLCANNVAVPPGRIVYTGMLNHHGGYETDCTVTRLDQNKYLMVGPAGLAVHDAAWLSRHLPPSVSLRDVTARYCVLGVMGPRSRELLQRLTATPLDNEHFPFATVQTIDIGFATGIRAMRITYVGELGWELHIPSEYAANVYDRLTEEGAGFGLRLAGMYAVDSLRMEKGYRHWGHDLDTHTTPWEARLAFAVDMKKGDFIGREALVRQKEEGLQRMLGIFSIDTGGNKNLLPWGNENIFRNGKLVGYADSVSFAHSIGTPICMGYVHATEGEKVVTTQYLKKGDYEVEVNGKMCPAQISLKPLYDPKSLRVKQDEYIRTCTPSLARSVSG